MKKTLLTLAGISLLALSCSKTETIVEEKPVEIGLKAVTSQVVKADPELTGASLGTNNSYVIYAAASATGAPKYFSPDATSFGGQLFAYFSDKWYPATENAGSYEQNHIYWPFGGAKVDFLAYALPPVAKTALNPQFNAEKHAQDLKIEDWNTSDNQYDVLYAVKNDQVAGASGNVTLQFNHAQALLAFKAGKTASTTVDIKINSITIKDLGYTGTLTVDNYRANLNVTWTGLDAAGHYGDKNLVAADGLTFPYTLTDAASQVTTNLLIPEQSVKQISINYTMGGNDSNYNLNIPRGTWEMGKKYTYNLIFDAAEITFTESVTTWEDVIDTPPIL